MGLLFKNGICQKFFLAELVVKTQRVALVHASSFPDPKTPFFGFGTTLFFILFFW